MIIGRMDKRIQLQVLEKTKDGKGGYVTEWVTRATVWAELRKPNSQVQVAQAMGTVISELPREFSIRRRSDVCKGWQVKYGEKKTFSVLHAYDIDNATTIVVCREVVK